MTSNIKLLLKYEKHKKKSNNYLVVGFNILLLAILAIETLLTIPSLLTKEDLFNYITFKIYQTFAINFIALTFLSISSIRDLKSYRYLLSYPIKYEELFAFIKLRKLKSFILTFLVSIISIFYLGLKFSLGLNYFIILFAGFIIITLLCWLISDILCFILYSTFNMDFVVTLCCFILMIPFYIITKNIGSENALNFHNSNDLFIKVFDKVFPYCNFTKQLVYSNINLNYLFQVTTITAINIVLFLLLYKTLIRKTFFKVLEKEDNKKSTYKKVNLKNLKPRNSFIANLNKEIKFIWRGNKSFFLNYYILLMFTLAFLFGITIKFFIPISDSDLITLIPILSYKKNLLLMGLVIYFVSLFIDILNFDLSINRVSKGQKYFLFDKYINKNYKNIIYSNLVFKTIVSLFYYLMFFVLLYLFNLLNSVTISTFIVCILNIISMATFNTIVDIKFPNIYTKKALNNILIQSLKVFLILTFKGLHFLVFFLIKMYLVNSFYFTFTINNLIFLAPLLCIVSSTYTSHLYRKITTG